MSSAFKTLLLTGAAGGLGKALVQELSDRFQVLAVDVDEKGLADLRDLPQVKTYVCDLRDPEAILGLRSQVKDQGIRIHTLINNAGISGFFPISEAPAERLDRIVEVNTLAPVRMVSAFLDHLIETQGRVIQISSESVKMTGLFQPYSASKIAMEAFSRAMRQELRLKGIPLVLIRPGAIKTPLLRGLESTVSSNPDSRYLPELRAFLKNALGMVGRESTPEEMAHKIARIVAARNPRSVYHLNNNLTLTFFSKLPVSWSDTIVHRLVKSKQEAT